jgi:hypothetical protein
MIEELIAFIRAQLDNELLEAQAATPGPWRHNPEKHWRKPGTSWFEEAVFAGPAGESAVCVAGTGKTDDPQSMADAAFIASHDPARVQAGVAIKRRWLLRAIAGLPCSKEHPGMDVYHPDGHPDEEALRLLGALYAGRPGYKTHWAPEYC